MRVKTLLVRGENYTAVTIVTGAVYQRTDGWVEALLHEGGQRLCWGSTEKESSVDEDTDSPWTRLFYSVDRLDVEQAGQCSPFVQSLNFLWNIHPIPTVWEFPLLRGPQFRQFAAQLMIHALLLEFNSVSMHPMSCCWKDIGYTEDQLTNSSKTKILVREHSWWLLCRFVVACVNCKVIIWKRRKRDRERKKHYFVVTARDTYFSWWIRAELTRHAAGVLARSVWMCDDSD